MTSSLTLYTFPLSGHAHRVELLLSMLGLPFQKVHVDLLNGEHKAPDFLARNALGQVPVLLDGELTLADSNAILVYLALRYDESQRWYPREPAAASAVQRWLSLAAGQLLTGPGTLRVAALFRRPVDRTQPELISAQLFGFMEATLRGQSFLLGEQPSIADLALYSSSAHAPEGGLSLEPYPSLRAWLARIEALPGFVPMTRTAT